MSEFALIQEYFARSTPAGGNSSSVNIGIGDDCAVLSPPPGKQLAISMDTLVEGVHFPPSASPEDIATRAFLTALSDLAAMGAKPLWFSLGLTLPRADKAWLQAFSESLFSISIAYGCVLIGGDTTRGPLSITVQVHGSVEPDQALTRAGAAPEDVIFVTGYLGDGAAGLASILNSIRLPEEPRHYLKKRFYVPEARIQDGLLLRGLASSAIDISDGLLADLAHICCASRVGAEVNVESLPIAEIWSSHVPQAQAERWAMTGGDDYQLCFTVPRDRIEALNHLFSQGLIEATAVGRIVEGHQVSVLRAGQVENIKQRGYDHFG